MTAENETPRNFRLCSVVSKAAGENPCGSGTPFAGFLGIEVAPPWKRNVSESSRFPDERSDAVERLEDTGIVGRLTGLVPETPTTPARDTGACSTCADPAEAPSQPRRRTSTSSRRKS